MQNPNFLILDEPTNDLDIMTLNVLEDYLQNFNGCVIIVSHDRYFMDKIVDHLFVFEGNGEIKNFPGNYSIYRDYKDENDRNERQAVQQEKKEAVVEKPQKKGTNKLSFNEKRELEQLENEIAQLEIEKVELENKMSSGEMNHEELNQTSQLYNETKENLDIKELRWLELSEKA